MIAEHELLTESPYQGYAYAYPHKTAYRPLRPAAPLEQLWRDERRDALFLYVHIPFCEMRCGFCNLFTQSQPREEFVAAYLTALQRQAQRVAASIGDVHYARIAVGGGTPTQLEIADLQRVLTIAEKVMGARLGEIPFSMEASPETTTSAKMALLRERGVTRLSLGVQSFIEAEARAAGRPQRTAQVLQALDLIRAAGFPTLNIDLIYGLPGQTAATWLDSIQQALAYRPEEIYLYPLFVRPLTGLGRADKQWNDNRLRLYREGRALLLDEGYEQMSMRMFRGPKSAQETGPVYCCQEDGMVGLGCGARSYTRELHYSNEYAVGARGVKEIISAYVARSDESFAEADYGFRLDEGEQRRRYLIQSLLTCAGLDQAAYSRRFGSRPLDDFPELNELHELGFAEPGDCWRLTPAGLERSDAVGPWLYSARVRRLMEEYEWH